MSSRRSRSCTATIGIDLGDKSSRVCVLGADGKIVEEASVKTSLDALRRAFTGRPPCRVIIETGTHSPWVSRLLSDLGHEVVVANARRVDLITRSQRKTDRGDAEWLARLGRVDPDLLSPIHHRGERAQADRSLIKARDVLVATRTQLINHARGTVKAFGQRLPRCGLVCFAKKAADHIPEPLRPALMPMLELIAAVHRQIVAFEKELRTLCADDVAEPLFHAPLAAEYPAAGRDAQP